MVNIFSQTLPQSMKALDRARVSNDLTTPAIVTTPTKTAASTTAVCASLPSLLQHPGDTTRNLRRNTTRKHLCKSGTYCEETADGHIRFQTPLQRKETVINELKTALKYKQVGRFLLMIFVNN